MILLASKKSASDFEKNFFAQNIPADRIGFIERSEDPLFSYRQIQMYKKIFTVSSTLGFEAAALGQDVVFFLFHGAYGDYLKRKFPYQYRLLKASIPAEYQYDAGHGAFVQSPSVGLISRIRINMCNFVGLQTIGSFIGKEIKNNESI